MGNEVTFEITEHLGVISEDRNGWKKEVNLVAWNGQPPKVDIRSWDEGHERMTRGITLIMNEAENLAAILDEWIEMNECKYIKLKDIRDAIMDLNDKVPLRRNTLVPVLKAIVDLPTIEVSEDCISKAYLEQQIENQIMPPIDKEMYWRGWNNALQKVVELIEDAPSVVPSRAEGEWIINEPIESGFGTIFECPYCKYEVEFEPTNYCPNCGAKMKGTKRCQ